MRDRAQLRRGTIIFLLAAVLTIPATVAVASAPSGNRPLVPSQDFSVQPANAAAPLTAAEADDLAQYASQLGVSVESLTAQTSGQEAFSEIVDAVQAHNVQSFVYSEWNSVEGNTGPLVVFNAPPKNVDLRLLETIGVPIHVLVVDAPNSVDRERAIEAVAGSVGADRQALVGADWRTSTIHIDLGSAQSGSTVTLDITDTNSTSAAPNPGPPARSDAAVLTAAVEVAGPFAIEVTTVADDPVTLEYRGGVTYGSCTAGFVVVTGATRGISGARHCSSLSSYDGASFAAASTHISLTGDVRWTPSTSGTGSGTFQADWGIFRAATGAGNPGVGSSVCHFGIATGYSCSTVIAVDLCNSSSVCGLAVVADNISAAGDSGGPWFFGGVARGIHTGTCTVNGVTGSCFTRISKLTAMSVSIATN